MARKRSEAEDAFGDAVYETWRAGLDPDRVDRDRVYDRVYDGADRYEAATAEVSYLRRRDRERREAAQE